MAKVDAEFGALLADRVPAAAFEALRVPMRLLLGTASPAPARRVPELLASACTNAVLVRLHGAGHLAPLNDAGRVLPRLPFAGPTVWPRAA